MKLKALVVIASLLINTTAYASVEPITSMATAVGGTSILYNILEDNKDKIISIMDKLPKYEIDMDKFVTFDVKNTEYVLNGETRDLKQDILNDLYAIDIATLNKYIQYNGHILVTDRGSLYDSNFKDETTSGYTRYDDLAIIISGENYYPDDYTLVHEMGHFVDYIENGKKGINRYSIPKSELEFLEEERGTYYTLNNNEFFAEAYVIYTYNNLEMKEKMPTVYEIISNIEEKI